MKILKGRTMKTQERIDETVRRIRAFDKLCGEDEYTDTGDAWDLIRQIESLWSPLYKKKRQEPLWVAMAALAVVLGILIYI